MMSVVRPRRGEVGRGPRAPRRAMPRKLKPALVRGRPAVWWEHSNGCLILRGPHRQETEVPVAHLTDEVELARHILRLEGKNWVEPPAIDELRAIADGALR